MSAPDPDDATQAQAAAYGGLAAAAADALIDLIGPAISGAVAVDAACGAGLLAERLAHAGYAVRGADPSAELVAEARRRVPGGRFVRASLLALDLPPCRAICAIGEAINAQVAPGDEAGLSRFVARAHAALERGGILLIDVAAPGRGAAGAPGFAEGAGWAAGTIVRKQDDRLIRSTTVFAEGPPGTWRREQAEETLSLWPREHVEALLRAEGFTVQAGGSYGALALPPGLVRYTAQK
jgi:SAM-dependent methyltransferase